jgi:hypothetical protein
MQRVVGGEDSSRTLLQVGKECQYTHSLIGVQYCLISSCNSGAAFILRIKNERRAIRSASSFQPASTCGVS